MATITRLVMFDERLYHGNGDVNVWMTKVLRRFKIEAVRAAPPGRGSTASRPRPHTFALKRGIRASKSHRGAKLIEGFISSNAPHTMYVIKGTAYQGRRYIYSRAGWPNKHEIDLIARRITPQTAPSSWFMPLPPPGTKYHLRVHGQKANNFLFTAWTRTGHAHPAISRGAFPRI